MKKTLLFVFAFLISLSVFSQATPTKNLICENVFSYEVTERSDNNFDLTISKSSNDNFNFKLFSIKEGTELISEIRSDNSSQSIEFKGLDKNNFYLVQVYGLDNDCRFTIGGMEGIKYENK
jgi:hypothetical protein